MTTGPGGAGYTAAGKAGLGAVRLPLCMQGPLPALGFASPAAVPGLRSSSLLAATESSWSSFNRNSLLQEDGSPAFGFLKAMSPTDFSQGQK